ncbi:MAG: metallophosphoesterase family protein [Oscillospiraceae bacterium]|nr:metallophosphoesterase family protein [Oscillospiraceae bacterium]
MMGNRKVAVFSDIHSNYHAFKACYEDAVKNGATQFIFLGDYVSDLAEPAKTMDLLYEIQSRYPTVCLRGNRERYMLEHENGTSLFASGSKSGSLLFTYEHLRKKDLDFFRSLPISSHVCIDGVEIEIAHASKDDDRFYFEENDPQMEHIFAQMKCNYLLTGHCHKQYIQHKSGKTIINPGSVGIPQGGSIWPKYAILQISDGAVSCLLREVPYNICEAIHSQFDNGLVNFAKYWAIGVLYDIMTGQECVLALLNLVSESGNIHEESDWHSAAIRLGLKLTKQEIIDDYHNRLPKSVHA